MRQHQGKWSRAEKGFSPTELLVAIVTLGILAAVIVFGVQAIGRRHQAGACQTEVAKVNNAIDDMYAKTDPPAYPTGTSVTNLGATLVKHRVLKQNVAPPRATAKYTPKYDPATGTFAADCP